MTIQCAPIGITALPCYVNDDCAFNGNMKISEALKKLGLYSNHKNENISDISLLIGKWNFCNRINISKNKVRAIFLYSNKEINITLATIVDFHTSRSIEHTDRTLQFRYC
eukprot:TRINITY_DN2494_c0_g1_i17.p1 TRINITY_DN2494_c0_g1~~TRINITY_DN2494_c0_g1_i17.p1  ORF type:complete len:110 (-),score=6.37 TRINITY_DN2494_c0_g1_i17:120-449(-)